MLSDKRSSDASNCSLCVYKMMAFSLYQYIRKEWRIWSLEDVADRITEGGSILQPQLKSIEVTYLLAFQSCNDAPFGQKFRKRDFSYRGVID